MPESASPAARRPKPADPSTDQAVPAGEMMARNLLAAHGVLRADLETLREVVRAVTGEVRGKPWRPKCGPA